MSRYFKYFLFLLALITCGYNKIYAQNIQVDARLDKQAIVIGDQTQLHLSIRFKVKDSVGFPALADSISGKIQIVGVKADTTFDKTDVSIETIRKNYTITSFDSGTYVIPSYAFKTPNGILKTNELSLQVATVPVDTTKAIYDIKQPLAVKYTFMDWLQDNWGWVAGGLAALLAIGAIIYYLRKKPKKEVTVEVKPDIPAHIIALEKLNAIRDKKLWQQEQIKQYYIELSDVIREYLEKRYAIQALEQTTEEIFASLRYLKIAEENRDLLRRTLLLADMVKFAKEKPLPFENEESMVNAVSFVTQTQKPFEPAVNKEDTNK